MRQVGTATTYVARLLDRPAAPATLLGAFATACYLELADGAVLALLTEDAIQLPIGLTVPGLTDLSGLTGSAEVGDGVVTVGAVTIEVGAERCAALRFAGRPRVSGCRSPLFDDPPATVAARLGFGPGLTPAGDDELCGALAAITLFDAADYQLADAVMARLAANPNATTSLSRALLERAVAGDGLPQLQRLADAMCTQAAAVPAAWTELLRIGHSSGAALGAGLLAGARHVVAMREAA